MKMKCELNPILLRASPSGLTPSSKIEGVVPLTPPVVRSTHSFRLNHLQEVISVI